MASLVIVAAILIAVKSPDWIEQYKQHKAKQQGNDNSNSTLEDEYFGPSSDAHKATATGKRSKREILSRRYWHERRESSRHSRDQTQMAERRESGVAGLEAPPPYNGPPMYQEIEKAGELRVQEEYPSQRGLPAPEYLTR
ncbi:hypothetical protein BJX64DRAFT_271957 [Aspergillus heterothallicus]